MSDALLPARKVWPGDIIRRTMKERKWWTTTTIRRIGGGYAMAYDVRRVLDHSGRITDDMAQRLARVFGTSLAFWLNLQAEADAWDEAHKAAAAEAMRDG